MATSVLSRKLRPLPWAKVEASPPIGHKFSFTNAFVGRRLDLLIGIDSTFKRYVWVGILSSEGESFRERASRGLEVRTVDMDFGRGNLERFVEIACLETAGQASLDILVNELADELDAHPTSGRVRLVQNVVAKWQRFWRNADKAGLAYSDQLGLFGELWFLFYWLTPSIGIARAVNLWRGPAGARNDFETFGVAFEVKTTSKTSAIHTINGLEQLLEPENGTLFLFSLCVRDEASATSHLPDLIKKVRTAAADDELALDRFESLLAAAGYSDSHETEYGKLHLRVRREELFRVMDDFPRLIPSTLRTGVPTGISSVTYDWNPDVASPWRLASNPSEASTVFTDFVQ